MKKEKNNPNMKERKQETGAKASLIKLAVDVHKRSYTVVRQVDEAKLEPPQRFTPGEFRMWVGKQQRLAEKVVVCYESGPLGFVLARELQEMGVECLVMAPVDLDERRKGINNDRRDALEIARRLDRYMAGNPQALDLVRIPSQEEERRRDESRHEDQLSQHRRRLQAQGASLLLKAGYMAPSDWWQEPIWRVHSPDWPEDLRAILERLRKILLVVAEQEREVEQELEQAASEGNQALPAGLGKMTHEKIEREICDWNRFSNRREVAHLTGMSPSESSSGEKQWQGPITKHGNPRLRHLLIEAAWRMLRFQPDYKHVKYWRERVFSDPRASKARRKKAIVGLARQLAIDLWRLNTGQTSPEHLGLRMKPLA